MSRLKLYLAFVSVVFVTLPALAGSFRLPPSPAEEAAACAQDRAQADKQAWWTAKKIAQQKKTSIVDVRRYDRQGSSSSCGSEMYIMEFADGLRCLPFIAFLHDLDSGKRTAVTMNSLNCRYQATSY